MLIVFIFVAVGSSQKRWYGIREKFVKLLKPVPVSVGSVILGVLLWHIPRRKRTDDNRTLILAKNWEVSTVFYFRLS